MISFPMNNSPRLDKSLDYYRPPRRRDPWGLVVVIGLYVVLTIMIGILYHHHV